MTGRAIVLAREELFAALSILLDPASSAHSAEVHVLDAWRLLYRSSGADAPAVLDTLTSWIRTEAEPLSAPEREQAALLVSELAARESEDPIERGSGPDHKRLLAQLKQLERVVGLREPQAWGPAQTRSVWLWRSLRAAAALGLLIAFILVIRPPEEVGEGPWRADYYPTHTFEGTPILRRSEGIDFNWGKKPPLERISADKFSVRWESCLTTSEAAKLRLRLRSDDGAKLFVDGEPVIDLWKGRGVRTADASMELSPGVHHIRLDYFEMRGSARVKLLAALDEESLGQLPTHMLHYPGDDIDPGNVCRSVPLDARADGSSP